MPNVERFCTYRQCVDYVRRHCDFLTGSEKDAVLGGWQLSMVFKYESAAPVSIARRVSPRRAPHGARTIAPIDATLTSDASTAAAPGSQPRSM